MKQKKRFAWPVSLLIAGNFFFIASSNNDALKQWMLHREIFVHMM